MADLKETAQYLEKRTQELSVRLEEITSEKTRLDKEWATVSEELRAHQVVLASLPGRPRSSATPIQPQIVAPKNRRGRKPKPDLDPILRGLLLDYRKHGLKDILETIQRERGIIVARSTARSRYERMPDVEKVPGKLAYKLKAAS